MVGKKAALAAAIGLAMITGAWAQSGQGGVNPPAAQANPAPAAGDTGTPDIYGGRLEIAAGGSMLFAKVTSANGVSYTTSDVGGFNADIRYHVTDWIAVDAAYSYSQWIELYGQVFREASRNNQFSGDVAITMPTEFFAKPYILGGMGVIRFNPTNDPNNTPFAQGQTKNAIVYGGGLDFKLIKGFSLRAEYRGDFYRVPDFHLLTISAWNHLAQPSVMLVFHF